MCLGLRTQICLRNTVQAIVLVIFLKLKLAFQGDVICFRVFNQVIIVLCSMSAIKDLLEKRGEIYSERPILPIMEMYA
jgi:hypothetical protein